MAHARAPRLTREDCEQFLQDVRERNPRADVLLREYLDYCRRIALSLIKAGQVSHQAPGQAGQRATYLPHAILVTLRHVNGIDETTAQVGHNAEPGTGRQHVETGNTWVEEIAHDAILVFVGHVRTGRYHCRGHQVTTYLYSVVVNKLLKTAEKLDRQRKRGEVYGMPLDLFASGHDLSGTIYVDEHTKGAATGPQAPAGERSQQPEPAIDPAAFTAEEDPVGFPEEESKPPALGRLHPEQQAVLELIAAEETRGALHHCVEALPLRQRQLIAWMLRGERPKEIARWLGVKPNRCKQLNDQAFARLRHCLWHRVLLERAPRLSPLVPALDPSVGIHYARGLGDRDSSTRCWAGVQRALDTPCEALPELIDALAADRRAHGLDDRVRADLARGLPQAQQRVLVLALWSTEVVVLDPKSTRAVLKAPAGGHGYLAPDERPPV